MYFIYVKKGGELKLHIISDIHKEKKSFKEFELPKTDTDAIVMAGDIANGFDNVSEYLKRISQEHEKKVFYVMGNNCIYGTKIQRERESWYNAKIDGVEYLDTGIEVNFSGYKFVGGILWPMHQGYTREEIINSDYDKLMGKKDKRIFKDNGNIMTSFDHIKATLGELKWLETALDPAGNNIVITHYAPSWISQHELFPDDDGEGRHANDVDYLIKRHKIDLWIHGHVHSEIDYNVGATRIYANPVPPGVPHRNTDRLSRIIIV
jgi:Icc-related predicted phosphoesterase